MQGLLPFVELIVFAVLLLVGYVAGRIAEKAHYRSIRKREKLFERVTVFSSRFPPTVSQPFQATLVASMIVNVKFQTVQVPGRGVGAVELLAYGTALRRLA
jgi:hypothetical protein